MKIRYIILTFLVAFITLSCEDWIELRPENSVTFENAFDTEKDIEAALFGTEQSLRINMTAASWQPQTRGEYSDYRSANSDDLLVEQNPLYYEGQWS